ncbi:MAG: hypothetical protein KJ672_02400 [Candidatus Thermoplasmatota archaeon]|nr:hypothetical protein [Candidatus Thermoplasmatota archaeon]
MTKKMLSSKDDIEESLARVGASLPHDVTAYLIGGCAMILFNAKVATKDVDLVLMSDKDAEAVMAALSGGGFTKTKPEDETYRRLGATIMMEDRRGTRFDIFVETVCRKLRITDRMVSRSTRHAAYGRLVINLVSPEDIFLFKSVTERAGDLDDMALLAERGLDWDVILSECVHQSRDLILEAFLAIRLQELEEAKGIVSPIKATLEILAEKKLRMRKRGARPRVLV